MAERTLSIYEKALGDSHPLTGYTLNLLGIIHKNTGDLAKAEELYLHSIDIKLKTQGPYHPDLGGVYANLANLYFLKGETEKAVDAQNRANAIMEYNTALNLVAGSEKDKINFLATYSVIKDQTVTLNFKTPDGSVAANGLGVEAILRWKGRVLDVMSDSIGSLRRRFNVKDQALLKELTDTSTQLSNLVLTGPEDSADAGFRNKIAELETKRDALEEQISLESSGFYERTKSVTLAAVQSAIPKDTALIEYSVYRPISPKTFELATERQNDPLVVGNPRYIAYVITSQGRVKKKDIGEVTEVDRSIDAFRQALRDPKRGDVKQLARTVDEKVMKPVRALVGDSTRLLLSPDGELNLMPFEALVDEQNRYLVERYAISYLSSGRDLLRMQVKRDSQSDPIIIANPAFGEPQSDLIAKADFKRNDSRNKRSITTTRSISDTYFAPLGGTAEEARSIQALFPTATLLSGSKATEAALKEVTAPSILHLATHGFFLTDTELPFDKSVAARNASATSKNENPLLRSGLALAGANQHRESGDDGILTALEASGLNLWGTKLVVLSACDTGLGEVRTGEGVYGLRRSFALAGAESMVMSLWPVSDYVTRELMTGYYKNLKQGMGRSEALRQVQLEMLKKDSRKHPFYWASFIESGNWTNLAGK
jgi:CHAT domain-containing protein